MLDKKIKTMLLGDTFNLIGIPYTDEDRNNVKRQCKIPEVYKCLNRNYRKKYIPDIENCNKLMVLND